MNKECKAKERPRSLTELKENVIELVNNCEEYRMIYFIQCFLDNVEQDN